MPGGHGVKYDGTADSLREIEQGVFKELPVLHKQSIN